MKVRQQTSGYVVRLERGEEFRQSLLSFAEEFSVFGAFFYGLGGAESARLSIYRYDKDEQYHSHDFAGPLEIINVTGNFAMQGKHHILHAHATISGPDMNASGGHVEELVVGGTCELFVHRLDNVLERVTDTNTGLQLLQLP